MKLSVTQYRLDKSHELIAQAVLKEFKVKGLDIRALIANIKENDKFMLPKSRMESKRSETLRLVNESLKILTGQDHIAKGNRPFPVFRLHLFCGSPDFGVSRNDLDSGSYSSNGSFGCVRILLCKKAIKTLNVV